MTLTSSDNFKETLKQQADIVRIVGDYVKLKKAGAQNFRGYRFRAEKTASFSVHATRQFYHCFGCGDVGGCLRLHPEGREYYFPGSRPVAGSEAGRAHAQGHVFQSGGGPQRQARMALLDVHVRAAAFFQDCGVPRGRMPAST